MKKILSFLLSAAMLISFIPHNVFASDSSVPALAVTLNQPLGTLFKNQIARASYTISSSGAVIGAKAEMYIDGVLLEGAGSQYFVLYGENKESFDFTVLPELDPAYLHTLALEITTDSGAKAGCYSVFAVSPTAPDIKMSITSSPLSVTPGTDLYYKIGFSLPDNSGIYKCNLRFEINGTEFPELDEETTAISYGEFVKMIPAAYTNVDLYNYSIKVTLNPGNDPALCCTSASSSVPMMSQKALQFARVKANINPLVIPARITRTTNAYAYASLSGYRTTISADTMVEYMNPDSSTSMRAAKVKTSDGAVYWVSMSDIYISREDLTIADYLTDEEREIFVNAMGYDSPTPYLIWVNKERQRLTVFMGTKGNWQALKTFPVATGTNLTPTPTTVCTYEYPTRWVTDAYTCSPVLSLYDGYAIHNQPVSHSGYITDKTIGKPASHGCIRMLQADVNWVYSYVPVKTTVVLY